MATVILVRHGRTTANASGVLAGRTPGIELDDTGREQAAVAGRRIADVPVVSIVSSPLERCQQTAQLLADKHADSPAVVTEEDLTECGYGDWQGRKLSELAEEPLWKVVQSHPSAAVFPGGESLPAMQARAAGAVRRLDASFEAEHGAQAVWVAVSHGDIIKSILADALGMHLDLFQRLHADPASISVIRYGQSRPQVISVNTSAGDLSYLRAQPASEDAAVGGGAGPQAAVAERS